MKSIGRRSSLKDERAQSSVTGPSAAPEPGARAAAEFARLVARPLAPGLYLVATPIGNLGDITLRALAVLAQAGVIYCEDTRRSRTLLEHFGLAARLRPYHEHNAEEQRPRVLEELTRGKTVALVCDAGTPLISDPGYKLVREAAAAGHAVVAIPGPSAALAALTSSGLPTDAFFFAGFLPVRDGARRARIAELAALPATIVLFEAPSRVARTLCDLAEIMGSRPAAVARELTKVYEEVRRASLPELAEIYARGEPKGEVVIVVGPPLASEVADAVIADRLGAVLSEMSLRDAAKAVAEALGVPKARVYDLALKLKRGGG
ncbi:MAG TPA: 16S rRNA (cytidine(1402)-2'-O)-methyltransferase [Hyphomicrobiaceae bacterium]|nr:16S rRNA (cytidine(1402)-2'-O)-methyltransferase [Hyphomicrobiaceae bacterium]